MEQNHEAEVCEVCGLDPVVRMLRRSSRIVAQSAPMQAVLRRAGQFAASNAPIVILGESGTGKEVIARALHANSARRDARFVAVNVAALPPDLLESELFGHARGAFTGASAERHGLFAAADHGTLFLDEIAEMPLALQAKLLRVLQDGEVRRVGETVAFAVDARILCATHRDLRELVDRGLFREDLYYRLKVLTLRVPPLRDRVEDILPLARMMLQEESSALAFSAEAAAALELYRWPGNVRELGNAIKHGMALARHGTIGVEHLPEELLAGTPTPAPPSTPTFDPQTLADVERTHVLRVLEACGGSQVEAARVLRIGRNTLWRKLRTYG